MRASMSRRGWLLFAAMCVIWGVPYLLIKIAVEDMSPALLVLGRTTMAALILLPIAAARSELRPAFRHWRPVLAFAAIEIALPWLLLGEAETEISSSLTGLLIAATPLIGTAIALTTGTRERLSLERGLGLLLGLVGVAAIVGVSVEGARLVPIAEVGLVAVCYAVGPVILQRWLTGVPALGVIAASLAVTTVAYVPVVALSDPQLGATVITYVNPAVAAILGVVVLSEELTLGMGVGFVLVLAGSVLATRPVAPRAASRQPTLEPAATDG